MTCGIYIITNKKNGKQYVGRSTNIEGRCYTHFTSKKTWTFPLYNAIKKHGVNAFDIKILESVAVLQQPERELFYILKFDTFVPHGYNIGGTVGGFSSKEHMALMPLDTAKKREAQYKASGALGHIRLKELRKNPEFEAQYLAKKSAASYQRERNIRQKSLIDPEYAAKIKKQKARASSYRKEGYQATKGVETFKKRMCDPVYAADIRMKRQKAAEKSHESVAQKRKDPEYAAKYLENVKRRQAKCIKTFLNHMRDPVFAAAVRTRKQETRQRNKGAFCARVS